MSFSYNICMLPYTSILFQVLHNTRPVFGNGSMDLKIKKVLAVEPHVGIIISILILICFVIC